MTHSPVLRSTWRALSLLLGSAAICLAQAAEPLPTNFHVDASQTSVSGLSSGAFMAVQLQVAYSASILGSGVVAGGPYNCAMGSMLYTGICMGQVPFVPPNPSLMLDTAKTYAKQGKIDALGNLANRRIYVFSGTKDSVVYQPAVDATVSFFRQAGVKAENLQYVNTVPAGHAFITPSYGNACEANAAPYISHCDVNGQGYDQAGAILSQIYGPLQAKASSLSGKLLSFNQRSFAATNTGMAEEAFLYVPQSCQNGSTCKVHVALHGCEQSAAVIGNSYTTKTGYNEWADTNNTLVLYPQVNASDSPYNPKGCWDWFAYTGSNYAQKSASQMTAIMKMVKALGSGGAAK
jgi:predicted peptidase